MRIDVEQKDILLRKDEKSSLDTLAQLTHNHLPFHKQQRAKWLTNKLVIHLVDLNSPFKKKYWNTYHCNHQIIYDSRGVPSSKYCNNRWCIQCSRIRTAKSINRYKPVVEKWESSYFLTLTVPNCKAEYLKESIEDMYLTVRGIQNKGKYREVSPKGIRKLEVTYNPNRNDYHPHFHILFEKLEHAEYYLERWLDTYPDATAQAQDLRQADENSIMELFKYMTKIISERAKSSKAKKSPYIYVSALDVIYRAIAGKRTFQNFGFKAPKVVDEYEKRDERNKVNMIFDWENELEDWIEKYTGELLSGYPIPENIKTSLVIVKGIKT